MTNSEHVGSHHLDNKHPRPSEEWRRKMSEIGKRRRLECDPKTGRFVKEIKAPIVVKPVSKMPLVKRRTAK